MSQANTSGIIPGEFPKNRTFEPIPDFQQFLQNEKIDFDERLRKKIRYSMTINDFDIVTAIGSGAFGKVYIVKHQTNNQHFALKVMQKKKIVRQKQIPHMRNEITMLEAMRFSFVVYLEFYFHDNSNVYIGMPLILGGELFTYMRKVEKFNENEARFYSAQVLLGLEYLHYLDLVYRDIKPENLLIDSLGCLKITDFGFCKQISGRTYTLCGTPDYLAPEIILSKGYGKSADYWAFGVLLYELSSGYTPFYAMDSIKLFENIVAGKYKIPPNFSADLTDLVYNILQVDLTRRYGNLMPGINDIKDHSWYQPIDWADILNYRKTAPYVPVITSTEDSHNFDATSKKLTIHISEKRHYTKEFADF